MAKSYKDRDKWNLPRVLARAKPEEIIESNKLKQERKLRRKNWSKQDEDYEN